MKWEDKTGDGLEGEIDRLKYFIKAIQWKLEQNEIINAYKLTQEALEEESK